MAEIPSLPSNRAFRRNLFLALLFAFISLFGVGVVSRYALLVVVLDGLRAALIMVPWALAGLWVIPLLRLRAMPLRWHLLLGSGLGLGFASLSVLMLGSLGILHRWVWIALLIGAFAVGLVRLALLLNATYLRAKIIAPRPVMTSAAWRCALLLLCPFAIMALLAASTPAGLIWSEEGYGYDILEYHLQVPKEYLSAGRINYLPHNVYANFPSNVEMLYLLAMIAFPDTREVSTIANMIHLAFAMLTVFAAWVAGREWSPQAGVVSALFAGSTGWLVYLSGLAYVENGLLLFGMAALACLARAFGPVKKRIKPGQITPQSSAGAEYVQETARGKNGFWHSRELKWTAVAGIFAGLACGCKYTGFVFILLPLFAGLFVMSQERLGRRGMHALVFWVVALTAVSPWLIRNAIHTGNPVFPLINDLFRGAAPGWTEEETAHWNTGHAPDAAHATVRARFATLLNSSLSDPDQRLSCAALLLGLCGLFWRRLGRVDAALLLILFVQLVVWFTATHLFARFLIPIVIPSVLLGARAISGDVPLGLRRGVMVFIVGACLWYSSFAVKLMRREWPGALPASVVYEGRIAAYEYFGWVNQLPTDAKVLLVGEARAFYFAPSVDYWTTFNRNPFLERIKTNLSQNQTPENKSLAPIGEALLHWLRARSYTHLLVNWSEVRRLTRTYGFAPPVTGEEIQQAISALEQVGLARLQPEEDREKPAIILYVVPEL